MNERNNIVKMKGNPLTLLGNEVKVGDTAPEFEVLDETLTAKSLDSFGGKIVVIVSVPSIDTPVCDMETRRFNQEAEKLSDNVAVMGVSMDLPFALSRWCAAAGVENVKMLSDHRDASFGKAFGVLIKELRLLARTVFVIDKDRKVKYIQYVEETTEEPNYDEVLETVKSLIG
ncbi:MAG: thiol peroxidase [candidate division Zixibacteria bacterium]